MGIVKRQGAIASIWNYLGLAFGYVNMLVLFPNILGVEKFGLIRVIIATSMVLSQFGEMGLSNTIIRFFPQLQDREKKYYGFLSWVLRTAAVLSLLLLVLLIVFKPFVISVFGDDGGLMSEYYYSIVLITIASVGSEILFGYSRAHLKNIAPVFIKEFLVRVLQLLLIVIYYYNLIDFYSFILIFSGVYVGQILMISGYLLRQNIFLIGKVSSLKGKVNFSEMYQYAMYLVLTKVPSTAVNHADVIMLGAMTDFKNAGIYSIAVFIANVVALPSRILYQISLPLVARSFSNNKVSEVVKIYKQSSVNQILVCGLIFLLIYSNFSLITSLLNYDDKETLLEVTLLIGMSKMFYVSTGVNLAILNQSKYYKWSFVLNLLLLILVVVLNFIFIPEYGMLGAAFATMAAILISSITRVLIVYIKLDMHPISHETFRLVIVLISLFTCIYFISLENIWLNSIVSSLVVSVGVFISVVYFNISDEMKVVVDNTIRLIKNKLNR